MGCSPCEVYVSRAITPINVNSIGPDSVSGEG
jgi:hypothetical protein